MGFLLLTAAVCDGKKGKIPNGLIVAGWLFSLAMRFWQEGIMGACSNVAATAAILAIGFLLFRIRAMGAGDVKLWSVLGGMYGLLYFFDVFAVTLCLAGIWSFIKLVKHRMLAERFCYVWSYVIGKRFLTTAYYDKARDGTKCTILLAPFTAAAYFLVLCLRIRLVS